MYRGSSPPAPQLCKPARFVTFRTTLPALLTTSSSGLANIVLPRKRRQRLGLESDLASRDLKGPTQKLMTSNLLKALFPTAVLSRTGHFVAGSTFGTGCSAAAAGSCTGRVD